MTRTFQPQPMARYRLHGLACHFQEAAALNYDRAASCTNARVVNNRALAVSYQNLSASFSEQARAYLFLLLERPRPTPTGIVRITETE